MKLIVGSVTGHQSALDNEMPIFMILRIKNPYFWLSIWAPVFEVLNLFCLFLIEFLK